MLATDRAGEYPRATRPTSGLIWTASRPGYRLPPLAAMPPQLQVPRPLDRVPGNSKPICCQGDWRHLPGTRWRTCISHSCASLDRPSKPLAITGLLALSRPWPRPLDRAWTGSGQTTADRWTCRADQEDRQNHSPQFKYKPCINLLFV